MGCQEGWQSFAMRLQSAGYTLQHSVCSTSFMTGRCSCFGGVTQAFECVLVVLGLLVQLVSMLWQVFARVAGIVATLPLLRLWQGLQDR